MISAESLVSGIREEAIAQEFTNQLYEVLLPDEMIPEIRHIPELKRLLSNITKQLQIKNLVLILQNDNPYPELITFCQKLSTSKILHIGWITDQAVPFRSFQPEPKAILENAIHGWLNELEIS